MDVAVRCDAYAPNSIPLCESSRRDIHRARDRVRHWGLPADAPTLRTRFSSRQRGWRPPPPPPRGGALGTNSARAPDTRA